MEESMKVLVDWGDRNLYISAACIIFNPLYWNVVSRTEYKYRILTSLIGSPILATYLFGSSIFLLGLYRDWRFTEAALSQPKWDLLQSDVAYWLGVVLIVAGMFFVLTSYYHLGFTGTFCGDYFGILMEDKVTDFPFNVMDNPMYWGSTMNFLGWALIRRSQAAMLLSVLVLVVYLVAAVYFEEPFTEKIYKEKDAKDKRQA